jgi:SAM-dependent methyltransferase
VGVSDARMDDDLVRDQIRYYEDRAATYEQCYFRRGPYDKGPAWNARWFAETEQLEAAARQADASGWVLELACGNGLWTRWLAPRAGHLTAVDASATMLARNAASVGDPSVEYVRADVFSWEPPPGARYDLIAFGFFLSHVPPAHVERFWARLRAWLAPEGTVFLCDDAWGPDRPRSGDRVQGGPNHAHVRRLDDTAYKIVKVFYRPDELVDRLRALGWDAAIRSTGEHFLFGTARPVA